MSYLQNYVPSATASSANQDDSAANSDASTSFFNDAWAGSSPQAHAPTTPLHHHHQHTPTQTYATLAPYGSDDLNRAELAPDFAIITGPDMESYCNQPATPLLDFLSLDMYSHLTPTHRHDPYVVGFKMESAQDWSELRAEIRAVFPNYDASSHLTLAEQMKQREENFSTEPGFGDRDFHHPHLPLAPQARLKQELLRITIGVARDVVSRAFAFLDMVLARSVNAMPEFRVDLALACLLMATELVNDEFISAPPDSDEIVQPVENNPQIVQPVENDLQIVQPVENDLQIVQPVENHLPPRTAYQHFALIAEGAELRAYDHEILSSRNRHDLTCVFASQWDWNMNCNSPLEWILLYLRNYAALTQGDENEFEEAGVPNLPEQTLHSAFYLLDSLIVHQTAGYAPYSLLAAAVFKAVTVDLLPVEQRQIDASLKYTGYIDTELNAVTKHIQKSFPHYMHAIPALPGGTIMDQGEFMIALAPIPADAPEPVAPVGPIELTEEEMAAATVMLMESDAWKEDDWDGELIEGEELVVQPIAVDAPYPREPTGVIVEAWEAEEIAAATAQFLKSDAWMADEDWDMEMEMEEEELIVQRIPEDDPYPVDPTGMVVAPWEEAGFAAATARLLESKEWMEDEDWDMDAEYAAATAELLAEDWEDVEEGKEEEEAEDEDAVYAAATAELLAEDWDDGMEVDEGDEMDWEEETDL
ncbi:hypothetical protein BJ741DRAFT_28696, partial [Chytriomyces cf. hyalinus JEL632]